jgi:hypothetical protein
MSAGAICQAALLLTHAHNQQRPDLVHGMNSCRHHAELLVVHHQEAALLVRLSVAHDISTHCACARRTKVQGAKAAAALM